MLSPFIVYALQFAALTSAFPNDGKSVMKARAITCSLKLKVGATDTCDIIVVKYGITIQNFINWNPSLGANCAGFVGGTTYCVRGSGTPDPITSVSTSLGSPSPSSTSSTFVPAPTTSKDGSCGGSAGLSCNGTSFGNCCSSSGFCGGTTAHCQAGCQPLFGTCEARSDNISTDGTCGGNGKRQCVGSTFGDCCSSGDYCGTTTAHCQAGCQSAFGTCDAGSGTVSTDGTCGGTKKRTCPGSTFGNCCSSGGYCGATPDYCKAGCQSTFGECDMSNISTDGKCGASNGKTCAGSSFGICCSFDGWCGSTAGHCAVDAACQPKYGICTSTNLSSDGRCGNNGKTCVGASYGNCCSSSGFCGTGVSFCAQGCQKGSSSACTTTNIPSLNGKCGSNNVVCAGGPFDGTCCSTSGYCGKGTGFPC